MGPHLEVWWWFITAEQQKKLPEMGPNAHPPEFSWKCLPKDVRHFYPRRKCYGNRYGPNPLILQRSHFIHTHVCVLSCSVVFHSCNPIDCSPPGSPVHGILQASILEWVAISFSNTYIYVHICTHVRAQWFFATPRTVAPQAPLSMEFSRQAYWSGLPLPSPGDLPDSRIESTSPAWQVDSLPLSRQRSPTMIYTSEAPLCSVLCHFNLLVSIAHYGQCCRKLHIQC